MTEFGDVEERMYTMVLPERGDMDGDGGDDDRARSVTEMESMAVCTGHAATATIYPIPLTPEEIMNPDEGFGEFHALYLELETLSGDTHRLLLRSGTLAYVSQAIKMHAQEMLEEEIRRTAPPEVVEVVDKLKHLMKRIEEEGIG
jgi:hypothetical protein